MPELSETDLAKLSALEALFEQARQKAVKAPLYTQVVGIEWPAPIGPVYYAHTQIESVPGFQYLPLQPVKAKLITSAGSPFQDLPQTAAISDDSCEFTGSDIDGELSALCYRFGAGIPVRVYSWYPDVDLLIEEFTGTLRAPKDANGQQLKLAATAGFRSAKLLLPRRLPSPGCMFIFGGLLPDQATIDAHSGCPYNYHLGGSIGVADPSTGLPWTDCARDSVTTCLAHLGTKVFFPGFATIIESVFNGQTKGPNLWATARGNENSLTEPIRVIIGHRLLKALRVVAFRPENDTNHPDKGFVAAQFEIGEGPFYTLDSFNMNNVPVAFEHQQLRYGTLGQAPTGFSPNFGSYSGTGMAFGRLQGDFRNVSAGDLSATIHASGPSNVRVYSAPDVFTEQYTTNPSFALLEMLTNKRWGYGEDHSRYYLQSFIDVAAKKDEEVSVTDPNGNVFTGTRSTCNVELTGRATSQQIEDFCIAHRISLPFIHNGKKMIVSLEKETIDDDIPLFTDFGPDVNICADSKGQPILKWSYVGDDELPNQYTVSFDDGTNGFNSTPLIFGNQLQQLAAGKAWGDISIRVINKDVPAFGVIWMQEAARLGNSLLALGPLDRGGTENNFSVTFTTWFSHALNLRMYSLIKLQSRALTQVFNLLGIPGFQYFRILQKKKKGNLQVELTVQAYPVDWYESFETAITVPPVTVGPNPGGGPGDRPCSIGFQTLTHTNSTIEMVLQDC